LVALIWQMNWVPWIGWSYNAMLWLMLGLMDGAQRLAAPQEVRSRRLAHEVPGAAHNQESKRILIWSEHFLNVLGELLGAGPTGS
jgi:hypothetical protein